MPAEPPPREVAVPETADESDLIQRLRGSAELAGPAPAYLRSVVLALAGVALVGLGVRHLGASATPAPRSGSSSDPPDEVRTAEAVADSIVVQDGKRYRIGRPGDHLLVDDWRCDGQPTAAVFRPATQEVFVFSTWTATEPLAVDPIVAVEGAVSMVSERNADGCPTLAVRTEAGDAVPVDLGGIG